jgi:hypothetical protein
MAELTNVHGGNVVLRLRLLRNKWLDVRLGRDDGENWIPFEFSLRVDEELYEYPPEAGVTFTVHETRELLTHLSSIVAHKLAAKEFETSFEKYEYYNLERNLGLVLEDALDEGWITIEVWLMIEDVSLGQYSGYDKGFRFVVSVDALAKFTQGLEEQLQAIIGSD